MRYSIVIPTYNHCDDLLKPCVDSILKYTNMEDVQLVISANGCTDETKEYIMYLAKRFEKQGMFHHFAYAFNKEPLGYAKAVNEGLRGAVGEKIVLLNNDTVLLDQPKNEWLRRLDGHDISGVLVKYSKEVKCNFAVFFCAMIDRRVFKTIGLLNEEYGIGGCEDIEFCKLAQDAGFSLHDEGHRGDFPIYHVGEGTMLDTNLVENYHEVFMANQRKLGAKYE